MPDAELQFAYLAVHTPWGHGGPSSAADYAEQAAAGGYAALACADYGSVAAWPFFDAELRARKIRPIFGLACDVLVENAAEQGAGLQPVMLLAATAQGLHNLILLHNRLTREPDGRCWCSLEDLAAHTLGTWLILLPVGEFGPAPLASLPRKQALALIERLVTALPAREIALLGLPSGPEQVHFAGLAEAAKVPALALPVVRYPQADLDEAHRALHPTARWDTGAAQAIIPADSVATHYAAHPEAFDLACAIADSCRPGDDSSLAALRQAPGGEVVGAELRRIVAEAQAASGGAAPRDVAVELAAIERLDLALPLLATRQIAATARARGVYLGATSGVAAAGALQALLGLCAEDPFGTSPAWLAPNARRETLLPGLSVAEIARPALLHRLQTTQLRLVPAGGVAHLGFAAALRLAGEARGLDAGIIADLVQLAAGEPGGEDALREAHRAGQLSGDQFDLPGLLDLAAQLAGGPLGPAADAEILVAVPAGTILPLLPHEGGQFCPWDAPALEALGAALLALDGDAALDAVQRALELAGPDPAQPDADALRLLITSGDTAGLPLPEPLRNAAGESTPGVLAADIAALLPDDTGDELGWAILGALVCGERGPHPWLNHYLRRRVGNAAFPPPQPSLRAILEPTCGLPLFREQVAAVEMRLHPDLVSATEGLQLRTWLSESQSFAARYGEALAAGNLLAMALLLKAAHPAAFLAGALEQAQASGATASLESLVLEAQRRGIALLPPDVRYSAPGFTIEAIAEPQRLSQRTPSQPPKTPIREVAPRWDIRWGLTLNPRLATAAAAIATARSATPEALNSLEDLCAALDPAVLSADMLEEFIRAGALDYLGNRAVLLRSLPATLAAARRKREAQLNRAAGGANQLDLFAATAAAEAAPEQADEAEAPQAETAEAETGPLPEPRAWEAALLGHVFAPHPVVAERMPSGQNRSDGITRHVLGGVSMADAGSTLSVPVVLTSIELISPAPNPQAKGERIGVAWVEDSSGRLPMLIFPPVYTRFKALCEPGTAMIVTARVRLAEPWAGAGSQVVLVCEHLAPYEATNREQKLDVTPIKGRRAPAQPRAEAPKSPPPVPRPSYLAVVPREPATPAAPAQPAVAAATSAAATLPPSLAHGPTVLLTMPLAGDDGADELRMRRLKAILTRHPGATSVVLYFPEDPVAGMPTHMPLNRFKVDPTDEFCDEVRELLGAECVQVLSGGNNV